MLYENVETYLNEEVRRPIKHHLKGVDEAKVKEVMNVVDYLCEKYREMNAIANLLESKIDKSNKIMTEEIVEYIGNKCRPVDYDKLESPFTEEELEAMYED